MDIKRTGSQPSGKGPTDWFTAQCVKRACVRLVGPSTRLDPLFQAPTPGLCSVPVPVVIRTGFCIFLPAQAGREAVVAPPAYARKG